MYKIPPGGGGGSIASSRPIMFTLFGCAQLFNFVSFLLYPTEIKRLKCAMIGAFNVIRIIDFDTAEPKCYRTNFPYASSG